MIQADRKGKLHTAVFARDGYCCALCNDTQGLHTCHVIQNGSDHEHNLITLCGNCCALAHGMPAQAWPEVSQGAVQHGIVEYLAGLYGQDWNPYRKSVEEV